MARIQTQAMIFIALASALPCILAESADCSRTLSKRAHELLSTHVYPEVTAVNYELPPDCPLRPDLDLYAPYEAAKKKIKRDLWQCKLCNKQFKAEGYLDRHIASKHQDDLPTNATSCFSDFCSFLLCEEESTSAVTVHDLCHPLTLEKNRAYCAAVMHKCFPPSTGDAAQQLHDLFMAKICKPLRCDVSGRKVGLGTLQKSSGSIWEKLRLILGIILLGVLVAYYVTLHIWASDRKMGSDLRRVGATRQYPRWMFWKKEKPKLF